MSTTLDLQPRVPTRHLVLGVSAVLAPLLFLAGQALLPALPEQAHRAFLAMLAHRDQLLAARLLTAAGAFLLVPAAVLYAHALPRGGRGRNVLVVGAAAFGIATFFNAVSQAVEGWTTYAVTAPGAHRGTGEAVVNSLGTGLVGAPIGFWSIPVFALGAVVMAVGLLMSRRISAWLPALLIIGTVLAAGLAGRGTIVGLTQLPFTVALILLGQQARLPEPEADAAGSGAITPVRVMLDSR